MMVRKLMRIKLNSSRTKSSKIMISDLPSETRLSLMLFHGSLERLLKLRTFYSSNRAFLPFLLSCLEQKGVRVPAGGAARRVQTTVRCFMFERFQSQWFWSEECLVLLDAMSLSWFRRASGGLSWFCGTVGGFLSGHGIICW